MAELVSIQRGRFSPRPRNNPIYYNGDIPFVQTSDVVNSDGYISTFSQTLNKEGLKVSKLFPKGTILITIAANIGYCGVLELDMACPDSLIGLICSEKIYNRYLNFYLYTQQKKIDYLAPQGAQRNINVSFLEPYIVPFPTLPEQQKIATFLTTVDTRIQQLSRKKALLEQYKKGVMQQIFSQEIRFKDEDGKVFPAWEEKKISDVAPLQRGFDLPVDNIIFGNYPVVFSNGILKTHNVFKVAAPGVVTGRSGTIGKVTYVEENYWPHNTSLWVTDFKGNDPKFIYFFFIFFRLERFGSGSGVPTLNRNDVHAQSVLIPSPLEQQKIAAFLSTLDRQINLVSQQLERMQSFKKGLLQQMFV